MLVIDGVELIICHEPFQMRELHCDHATWSKQALHARDKVVQVRYVGQDIVSEQQVGRTKFARNFIRQLASEEAHGRWHTLSDRHRGNIGCRLNAEDRNTFRQEVLQKVTVIAGNLYDFAIAPRPNRAIAISEY